MKFRLHLLAAASALALASSPAIAQTQAQMRQDACAAYQQADRKLNATYQQVLTAHKDDAAFVAKLKKAQRNWLAFRDAELDALYPASNPQAEYGSVYPTCRCAEQEKLVQQRIEQLSGWLSAEEGDVCRGSR